MQRSRLSGLSPLLPLLLSACVDAVETGECNVDDDCAAERPFCLFDVNQGRSYCTAECVTDRDCPSDADCRFGVPVESSGIEMMGFCVRKVRACVGVELCNGLDDDCDGVVDPEGCEVQTDCLDDEVCGAFTCQAPADQASTFCAPPVGPKEYGDGCASNEECPNGLCTSGSCAPFCRARADETQECGMSLICTRDMSARNRPKHNVCQVPCDRPGDCEGDQECVLRDIYEPASFSHAAVCSSLDPERLPLGSECPSNTLEGDDMCQYGLCFGQVCTRICGGPGATCADVGPGFECATKDLVYDQVYTWDICVRR